MVDWQVLEREGWAERDAAGKLAAQEVATPAAPAAAYTAVEPAQPAASPAAPAPGTREGMTGHPASASLDRPNAIADQQAAPTPEVPLGRREARRLQREQRKQVRRQRRREAAREALREVALARAEAS
jgi:hypothetical protein